MCTKMYKYFFLGPMVQDGSVPLSFLKSACEPLLICNKAGLLVSEVLNDAVHRLVSTKVQCISPIPILVFT